jgi:hypothetical protein
MGVAGAMRRIVMRAVVVALSFLMLVSFGAAAQQPAPSPVPDKTGKIVAIGVGALIGIVAAEAIVVGDAAAIVGGVAGGVIAAWWYESAGDTSSPRGNVKPTAARQAAYHGETLVLTR